MIRQFCCAMTDFLLRFRSPVFICSFVALLAALPSFAKDKADLLVVHGTVVTMDAQRRIIDDGAVAVLGDSIVAVGKSAEIESQYEAPKIIDAHGGIIMPGLINGHAHAAMSLFRGIADDLALDEWLNKYIFPAEARNVTEDFVVWATRLSLLEMLRGGTTTYCDMYYFEDAVARVTKEAGMRGVLAETIIDFPGARQQNDTAGLRLHAKIPRPLGGRPAHHRRRRAALDLHAIGENASGFSRARAPQPRSDRDSHRGSALRVAAKPRKTRRHARRIPRTNRLAWTRRDRRSLHLGGCRRHRDPHPLRRGLHSQSLEQHENSSRRDARRRYARGGPGDRSCHGRRRQQQQSRHVRGNGPRREAAENRAPRSPRACPRSKWSRWRQSAALARCTSKNRSARSKPARRRT